MLFRGVRRSGRSMCVANCRGRKPRGFTLIELIAVIAIVSLLAAIALPAVQRAREAARALQCQNHLKQIGIALQNYHDQHLSFPPGSVSDWSWISQMLPQMERADVYRNFDFRIDPSGEPWFLEAGPYCSYARTSVIAVMAAAAGIAVTDLFAAGVSELRSVATRC